jgi:hypothetical protein
VEEDEGEASDPRGPKCCDEILDNRGGIRFSVWIPKNSGTNKYLLKRNVSMPVVLVNVMSMMSYQRYVNIKIV